MQKVNYYEFWKNLYPDIENFNIIENLYRELNNSNLSDDTVKMIEKLQDNSFDFQNDDLKFYLKHKNNFRYREEHQYFEGKVMYYNFYKPYVNFLINQLYLHEKSLQVINIKRLQESLEKGLLKILTPIGGRVLIRETEVKKRKKELVGDTKSKVDPLSRTQ